MNKRLAIFILLLNFGFVFSCSEKPEEMDAWERAMAIKLQAENIQLVHISNSSTINGIPSNKESYLQLEILNSMTLERIEFNKRLMEEKAEELKRIISNLPEVTSLPAYNEIRLNIIKKKGFFPFKTESINTITLSLY
jgi:hypothetical protein